MGKLATQGKRGAFELGWRVQTEWKKNVKNGWSYLTVAAVAVHYNMIMYLLGRTEGTTAATVQRMSGGRGCTG